ncbi:LacI family DNA-binding transcriptional regulator [Agreia pratensis]|uniref:Transcriptional regulator, LacI family n=1 Tax=Agreia pratensis TaxID=150121 RepID=A0A1X7IZ35_9MICO|nr:LacI family DNA-binding transcriptional regulator [Agreia pratensis]MBF4636106.1 LacI family DNA-binding transcriptional regulator [Agreia pratensis]SMG20601.1 transcriptional regulator, LacI family [Agreia pratensis]
MVTIRDVAADAGVARSTVSYVLSGNKKLPEKTRLRVLESVARLGYRPDPMARALALRRTNILGLLASIDPSSRQTDVDVFMRFVRAAMYAARARGFDLLMMGSGEDELARDVLADALIVMDIRRDDPRLPVLASIGLPTVLVGYPGDSSPFSAIDLDFKRAARIAVDHLADLGHTEIAVLGLGTDSSEHGFAFALLFREGFLDQCAIRGVRGAVIPNVDDDAGVDAWLDRAQDELPGLSAVITHGPGSLEPFIDRLLKRGLSIPEDCSIMTVAPEEVMRHADRPVTVVDLPGEEMVSRAVNLVLDELSGSVSPGITELLPALVHDFGTTAPYVQGEGGRIFTRR